MYSVFPPAFNRRAPPMPGFHGTCIGKHLCHAPRVSSMSESLGSRASPTTYQLCDCLTWVLPLPPDPSLLFLNVKWSWKFGPCPLGLFAWNRHAEEFGGSPWAFKTAFSYN